MPDATDTNQPGPDPGDRQWHWDGQQWHWWNGYSWQVGDPAAGDLPPVPHPPHEAPGQLVPPPAGGPAAAAAGATSPPAGRPGRWGPGAIIALVAIGAVLLLALGGGALYLFTRTTGADEVVSVSTEPLGSATDPFTEPVGIDTPVTPVATTSATSVPGGQAGLYGGTLDTTQCDKAKLVAFLQANPDKARAWAAAQGITVDQIPAFVAGLTPLLLRSDTLVMNHGFTDGRANAFQAVLQAGTAVLVNDRGLPVVKCYCGNPLGAVPRTPTKVRYNGPTWTGFTPGGFSMVQNNTTVIQSFTVTNITNNTTFTRPTGSDGGQDQPADGQSSPPVTTAPPTIPATPEPTGGGDAQSAVRLLSNGLDSCAASVGASDFQSVASNQSLYQVTSTPTGSSGVYQVTLVDPANGDQYAWNVNVTAGTITAANQLTSEFDAQVCPNL